MELRTPNEDQEHDSATEAEAAERAERAAAADNLGAGGAEKDQVAGIGEVAAEVSEREEGAGEPVDAGNHPAGQVDEEHL